MIAVTVRQPWARCIAAGHKPVENRSRNFAYRGPIAIHAGKTSDRSGVTDRRVTGLWGADPLAGARLGAVVAVADVVDCHEAEQPVPEDATCCWPWGDRSLRGRPAWHIVLANVQRLAVPVPCRGRLHVGWNVPDDVVHLIQVQLDTQAETHPHALIN